MSVGVFVILCNVGEKRTLEIEEHVGEGTEWGVQTYTFLSDTLD